jgi:mono/diheme cytochrome c family protein
MLRRLLKLAAVAFSALLLIATGLWLYGETRWGAWSPAPPETAFIHGAIGLETFPLKYALVLEEVSGPAFKTGREDGRTLWQTYGFLDNPRAGLDGMPACVANAADKLPVGIGISHYMPVKAFVSPVAFAGLTCAACHSAELRLADGRKLGPIYGAGNQELDIIAWSDGVRSAVLDHDLSDVKILNAYNDRCGWPTDLYGRTIGRLLDRLLISAWLEGIRASVGSDLSRYDLPYAGGKLKEAADIPAGPGRTRPFRSIVRVALNLPGAENMAMSKIPAVFEEAVGLRPFSQYDGSIGNPTTRSMIAAFASGASAEALAKPEVAHNIASAAAFTETLGIGVRLPRYRDLFPDKAPDPQRVAAGFAVYQHACNGCHGNRPSDEAPWSLVGADRVHQIMPVDSAPGQPGIGTDAARLTFRYADMLPLAIWTALPRRAGDLQAQKDALTAAADKAERAGDLAGGYLWRQQLAALDLASRKYRLGHPLAFPAEEIRYTRGYVNNPIPRAFLRAPYLHNGSVPTLRQLINLDKRPAVFCRGENVYDPDAIGLAVTTPDANGSCPDRQPFRFDTSAPGNANTGHDFPWRYDDPAKDPKALENLLEYLKVL